MAKFRDSFSRSFQRVFFIPLFILFIFKSMSGRKRSSAFSITINHVEWSKSCLSEFLMASDDIRRLVISEETHHPPADCDTGIVPETTERHHHVFVEFKEKYFLDEVRAIFEEFLGQEPWSFDVQVRIPYDIYIS